VRSSAGSTRGATLEGDEKLRVAIRTGCTTDASNYRERRERPGESIAIRQRHCAHSFKSGTAIDAASAVAVMAGAAAVHAGSPLANRAGTHGKSQEHHKPATGDGEAPHIKIVAFSAPWQGQRAGAR